MNSRRDTTPTPATPVASLTAAERLDDYLEHLVAPLVGIVPYPERLALRREARAHLEGLIEDYVWQGQDQDVATEAALREFGEPWQVGQTFLQEWLQGSSERRPALLVRKATCIAFVWFGIGALAVLLPLERDVFSVPGDDIRSLARSLAVATPIIAGVLTGAMASMQAKIGVRNAVAILALHSLILGCVLLPRTEGILLAAWQIVFWLPVGYVTAEITAHRARMLRRQRFWQTSRT